MMFISRDSMEVISDTDGGDDDTGNSDDDDDDDDDDREFEGRYDRKQNLRDVNDLQQSLRQRLMSSQSVLSFCAQF